MDEKNNQFDNESAKEEMGADIEIKDDVYIDVSENDDNLDIDEAGMSISIHASNVESKKEPVNLLKEIREWLFAIISAIVIVVLLKGFVFDFVIVDGRSMQTTLMDKDRLVLTKLGYTPQKGDIVVLDANYKLREAYIDRQKEIKGDNFSAFDEFKLRYLPWEQKKYGIAPLYYVKRVIALEGEVIDINDVTSEVSVNGEVIDEPYLNNVRTYGGIEKEYPYTVDEGCVFVMGDNREDSRDSRFTLPGAIPHEAVLGKATFRFWPLGVFGTIE